MNKNYELNPTVKNYLEKYPNVTVTGMAWSFLWRMWAVLFIVGMAVSFLSEL